MISSQERRALAVPAYKPRINRLSTVDFVPAFGLHKISRVRASGKTFKRRVFDASEGTRDPCLLGEQFCWHPVLPDLAPPPRRALRPDPPVVCPGFGLDGLHMNSLVRASEASFMTIVFNAWGEKRVACSLGDRNVGVPSGPARPSPPTALCAAPPRPARGMSDVWRRQLKNMVNLFREMPCMKRAYKVKISVGPLVSNQEQRALLVPQRSRGCESMLNFPPALA